MATSAIVSPPFVIVIPDKELLIELTNPVSKYPPSLITVEQICFIVAVPEAVPVLRISQRIGNEGCVQ